jgi:hypothetical protein
MPVCWALSDGGEALALWELWSAVCDRDAMGGQFIVDWSAFGIAVSRRDLDDDERRMELIRAMKACASAMNTPERTAMYLPDED